MNEKKIKDEVKKRYSELAKTKNSCCSSCKSFGKSILKDPDSLGYSDLELQSIPQESIKGLGCGNPTALADIKKGETVLDLGSGAGIDAFLAAKKVGKNGHVIGIDMTHEMVKKGEKIAKEQEILNVEFKVGEIENLPIDNNSIDVIISNCVINLSPNKLKTFKEAFRVLRPNGRLLVSDMVTNGNLPKEIKKSMDAWSGCIAGALEKNKYLNTIKKAGFKNIEIIGERSISEEGMDKRIWGKIVSVQIRAIK
jgi:SAM-dependent methyltransferase